MMIKMLFYISFFVIFTHISFGQCYVKEYYLVSYSGSKRLLKFDGDYIIRYSDYKRIAKWDGTYLLQYANSRRIAILECPGRRSALAAAAYLLN
jgi:hypothetical protein